jgi:uridine phosphorylase
MSEGFHSAEIVKTAEGRQYHIGLAPGEVAPFVIMCGDTERVEKVAGFLDGKHKPISSREYTTITGKYKGIPVSVMCTGMGPDNTEIAIVELSQVVDNPTLIRVGSSGALKKGIDLGDLVISTGAVRLENTSTAFVVEGFPALVHHEVLLALLEAAGRKHRRHHLGLTATAPGFYGAQGRRTPFFKTRFPDIPEQLDNMNVSNIEMEASTLFSLSTLAGFRAGAVCAIYAQRHDNTFIDKSTKKSAELDCIEVALEAIVVLSKMDELKGDGEYWLPHMGI